MKKFLKFGAAALVLIIIISAVASSGSKKPKHATTAKDSPALVSDQGSSGSSAPAAPTGHPQHFAGNGDENIGTVKVPSDSTLTWSCPGCTSEGGDNFILSNSFSDDGQISVNSINEASGQTVIDAGTYTDVQVLTEGGDWTITITPGT
jgi:hypothetical protein